MLPAAEARGRAMAPATHMRMVTSQEAITFYAGGMVRNVLVRLANVSSSLKTSPPIAFESRPSHLSS